MYSGFWYVGNDVMINLANAEAIHKRVGSLEVEMISGESLYIWADSTAARDNLYAKIAVGLTTNVEKCYIIEGE